MNGAPMPTRDLSDGCYESGASQTYLQQLVLNKPDPEMYMPHDHYDLTRCLVWMQRYTKGNVSKRNNITNTLAKRSTGMWFLLFKKWTWLTHEFLYSDRLSDQVLRHVVSLLMGHGTGDYGFLKSKDIQNGMADVRCAQLEIEKIYDCNNFTVCKIEGVYRYNLDLRSWQKKFAKELAEALNAPN